MDLGTGDEAIPLVKARVEVVGRGTRSDRPSLRSSGGARFHASSRTKKNRPREPHTDDAARNSVAHHGSCDQPDLALLLEISALLTRGRTVTALLDSLLKWAARFLEADQCEVLLLDEACKRNADVTALERLRRRATVERSEGLRLAKRLTRPGAMSRPIPIGIAATVLAEKRAMRINDEGPNDGTTTPGPVRTVLCAPLLGGARTSLGALCVTRWHTPPSPEPPGPRGPSDPPAPPGPPKPPTPAPPPASRNDLEFLVALAGIGAVALENLKFAERSRQEALIRGNFERFFAPHLAARIASAPGALRRGGERRRVAVLFSDIRGFTALAARLTPDATASLLSEYFSEMAECVFTHGGTLDKFIGDAVMAQWGAPLSAPGGDDADRALEAGQAMLAAVARLNQRWAAQGRPGLEVGLGINYGEVFAGYLGSERRLEYTIIGDVVNTASRLCEAAQGGELLVTPQLKQALTRPHRLTPHGPLWLPGRARALPILRLAPASAMPLSSTADVALAAQRRLATPSIARLTRRRHGFPVLRTA